MQFLGRLIMANIYRDFSSSWLYHAISGKAHYGKYIQGFFIILVISCNFWEGSLWQLYRGTVHHHGYIMQFLGKHIRAIKYRNFLHKVEINVIICCLHIKFWSCLRSRDIPINYRQVSYIRRTKSQHLKDSRTVLRLSLPNPLKPDVKSRMKM